MSITTDHFLSRCSQIDRHANDLVEDGGYPQVAIEVALLRADLYHLFAALLEELRSS